MKQGLAKKRPAYMPRQTAVALHPFAIGGQIVRIAVTTGRQYHSIRTCDSILPVRRSRVTIPRA